MLLLSFLGSAGFVAAYVMNLGTQALGAAAAVAFVGLCAAAVAWAFWMLPEQTVVDERDSYPCQEEDRFNQGAELAAGTAQLTRRGTVVNAALVALGALGLAFLAPLRSLAPAGALPILRSRWRRGVRLIGLDRRPIRTDALKVDSFTTVFPEGAFGDALSTAVLIRVPPNAGVPGATSDGYVAFSKVCTHAGCPVALYRAAEHQLLCPCHQSSFDVDDRGRVISGPADRALPMLPLEVDPSGDLRAADRLTASPGPGYWEMQNG